MARGRRRAATVLAAPSGDSAVASTSLVDDYNAKASYLALQSHIAAAADRAVVDPAGAASQPSQLTTSRATLAPPDPSHLSASSASQFSAQQNNGNNSHLEYIHPDLRSEHSYYSAPHTQPLRTLAMSSVAGQQPSIPPKMASAPQPTSIVQKEEGSNSASPPSQGEAGVTDGRRGPRRELSTSKRAAQNRAAQRAFRQRKEGYIKKLEQQVQEFGEIEGQFKLLQSENYAMREYIIHLQSKLLDLKADMPQPPPNLNLTTPGLGHSLGGSSAATAAANLLANAAAAAAIQRQQEQEQQDQLQLQGEALAAQSATAVNEKDASPLARVAQAAAQLGNGGSGKVNPAGFKTEAEEEAMDTTPEDNIDQNLDRL